jgi:membrane protein implicated in regulation of membrane protease activity
VSPTMILLDFFLLAFLVICLLVAAFKQNTPWCICFAAFLVSLVIEHFYNCIREILEQIK